MRCVFKKNPPSGERHSFSDLLNTELQPFSKSVEHDGIVENKVVFEKVDLRVKSGNADIPKPENYELREMLRQGYSPTQLNVTGLFDSMDSLNSDNEKFMSVLEEKFKAAEDAANNVEPNKE